MNNLYRSKAYHHTDKGFPYCLTCPCDATLPQASSVPTELRFALIALHQKSPSSIQKKFR
ncbi:hypothetical protein ACJ2PR_11285 [Phormidesmis sp. 146-33]